jgi:histidinol-phosphate aminotransferase
VLRTLSKAYGLAAVRSGVLLTQNPLVKILASMMMPFPFSILTTEAIKQAVTSQQIAKIQQQISYVQHQREILKNAFKSMPIVKKVWNSEGNFLFAEFYDVTTVLHACHKNNVLVRHFAGDYANCLRISVGLETDNQKLIKMLKTIKLPEKNYDSII